MSLRRRINTQQALHSAQITMNIRRALFLALLVSVPIVAGAKNAEHAVVVVWDGLRPDSINERDTPALYALAKRGVFFKKHHSVYPTSTEVNGVAIAAGASPNHTGIVGNREYRADIDPSREVRTEEVPTVQRGDALTNGKYLGVGTVAETLQMAGVRTAIAGTKPIAFLQDRRADIGNKESSRAANIFAGQVLCAGIPIFIGQPAPSCPTLGSLLKEHSVFPSVRFPNAAPDEWTTDVLTRSLWKDGVPKFSLLWLSEPDYSQHHSGLGSETSIAALRSSDRNLLEVLETLKAKGVADKTDVFVVSDHGFSTIARALDLVDLLNRAGLKAVWSSPKPGDIMVVGNGGSALFYVIGHDTTLIKKLVEFLQASDFAGVIFTRKPQLGCFLMELAKINSSTAPDVILSMRWSSDKNTHGVVGLIDSEDPNPGIDQALRIAGNGHHASASPFDMHNTLIAAGPDFRSGATSDVPSGNIDLAPTVLHILGVRPSQQLDGRILSEAFSGDTTPLPDVKKQTFVATAAKEDRLWRQYLQVVTVGTTAYIEGGNGRQLPPGSLYDPDSRVPFAISGQFSPERELTETDFSAKARVEAPDGTHWIADQLGPFLLHADSTGKLLESPIEIPDPDHESEAIRSPQNPLIEQGAILRVLEAFRRHAQLHGNRASVTLSPDDNLLADNNPHTFVDNRAAPPAGSNLVPADSKILDVAAIRHAGFLVVPYTVDCKERMIELMHLGVTGIISDRPDLLVQAVRDFDEGSDGHRMGFIDADGLIDINKFDAQGHRGGRNLRPENTLPAMEAGLDNLVTSLETDCGITKDGVPILSHDQFLAHEKFHRLSTQKYEQEDQVLIKDLSCAEIQSDFRCDKLLPDRGQQKEPVLSPVTVSFFTGDKTRIYTPPTLQQLFGFVHHYVDFYKSGAGKVHPDATRRWKNAARVHFNIETKTNPRLDSDGKKFNGRDVPFNERTIAPERFARAIAEVIMRNGAADRADIQSFDFRTLLTVQAEFPAISTVYLFGDFPRYSDVSISGSEDGGNLQDENRKPSPWLAGAPWRYRSTRHSVVPWGFEEVKLGDDKNSLTLILTTVAEGAKSPRKVLYRFDLSTRRFTANSTPD
jgi:glycerophosphoryl diester phosphodiesterase/arylsulfatase A-like enzyme